MEHVTAAAAHHTYHGTRSDAMETEAAANLSILCNCNYTQALDSGRLLDRFGGARFTATAFSGGGSITLPESVCVLPSRTKGSEFTTEQGKIPTVTHPSDSLD
jgi:hypothetical protein